MEPYPVLDRKERFLTMVAACVTGLLLGFGFIPASNSLLLPLFSAFHEWAPVVCFPALCLFFHLSVRLPARQSTLLDPPWCPPSYKPAAVALCCAFLFGLGLGKPAEPVAQLSASWLLVSVPLGEELLFRGWLWKCARRLLGAREFSFTNPIPATAVAVSFAFAFWHAQNFPYAPAALTLWQMAYSFFASLWLCSLSQGSAGVAPAVLAHAVLNASTLLGQRFSPL